jgi:hypothetical protein
MMVIARFDLAAPSAKFGRRHSFTMLRADDVLIAGADPRQIANLRR